MLVVARTTQWYHVKKTCSMVAEILFGDNKQYRLKVTGEYCKAQDQTRSDINIEVSS